MTVEELAYLNEYSKISGNQLIGIPDTKRILYYVIEQRLQEGGIFNLAIGGLRKVGKTTLLKQLAQAKTDRMYINLQYIRTYEERARLLNDLIAGLESKCFSVLLLDEVCRVSYYDDYLQVIVNCACRCGVSVIMTSSTRYYLRQLVYSTLGGRSRYLEINPMSYYEYLIFTGRCSGKYICSENVGFGSYANVFEDYKENFQVSEETFREYLRYCAGSQYVRNVEDYVKACYEDLIDTECSYRVKLANVQEGVDTQCVKELLYVLQYKMISGKKSLFESIEQYTLQKMGLIAERDYKNLDTTLHRYMESLRLRKRSELVEAMKVLISTGLVGVLATKTENNSFEDIEDEVGHILEGYIKEDIDYIFSSRLIVKDIGIYLNILRDFIGESGDIESVDDILHGPLYGEIIEYYVTMQLMLLAHKQYSVKLKCFGEYASEVDIVDRTNMLLVEVGIGNKHRTNLAFCSEEFNKHFPEFKEYERIYVSSIEKVHEQNYLELPYYNFGLYVDAKIVGYYVDQLR